MKETHARQNTFAILAALIWGTAFVAQSVSAKYLAPFTFNTLRAMIGFVFLLAVELLMRRRRTDGARAGGVSERRAYRKQLLLGGASCGAAMAVAVNFQQKGIETTSSGKAGFITALYIVIVPILGIFFKKRASRTVWIGVVLAVAGLYCLCVQEDFSIAPGDFYILICALCFSAQILLIDYFSQRVDGIELSCAQLFFTGVLSGVGMLATETPAASAIRACLWPLLYVGVVSSGVGYTLQVLAQKDSNPTVISLLLSLESVFATLAGAVILHDRMSGREILGCVLMLCAVVLAQLPAGAGRRPGAAEK